MSRTVASVCGHFAEIYQLLGVDTPEDEYLELVSQHLTLWRALRVLLTPSIHDFFAELDKLSAAVTTIGRAAVANNPMKIVAAVMSTSEYYKGLIADFVSKKGHTVIYFEKIVGTMQTLKASLSPRDIFGKSREGGNPEGGGGNRGIYRALSATRLFRS